MSEHVHLIGIGGTGMTALAGLLSESGVRVTGSDGALYPPTSEILAALKLEVWEGFDPAHLDPAPDLVVVGNAISRGNPQLEECLDRRLPLTSMPRLISERFLSHRHSIVVAGTHGKTTTTSMIAWLLERAGRDPGYLVGGLPFDLARPFKVGSGRAFVIEGDEYDSAFFDKGPKFMHYRPDTAVLGAVEFDHADIYRDLDEVKRAFGRFVNLVPRRGLLVRQESCDATREVSDAAFCRIEGFGDDGVWQATDVSDDAEGTAFTLTRSGTPLGPVRLATGGVHNVRNALAAAAVAAEQGLSSEEIGGGLSSFRGVRRRLEVRGEADGVLVLDDFAHHPTAIRLTLDAVRRRFPGRRIWAVLEPRSWSLRRAVFQSRLVDALAAADESLVAGVFRAEQIAEDERLDPARLVAELAGRGRAARNVPDAATITHLLAEESAPGDVVVVMSNGGFDGLHDRLLAALEGRATAAGGGAS